MGEVTQSFPGAFCEACNKWRKPSFLMPDGSCPRCRTVLAAPPVSPAIPPAVAEGVEGADGSATAEEFRVPWHFWVMVAATVLYLGWRVIQGIQSLF